jgi:hypothetical protein
MKLPDVRFEFGLGEGSFCTIGDGKVDKDLVYSDCGTDSGEIKKSSLVKSRHLSFNDLKRNNVNGTISNRDLDTMISIILSVCEEAESVTSSRSSGQKDITDSCNGRNEDYERYDLNMIGSNDKDDSSGMQSRDEEDMPLIFLSRPSSLLCRYIYICICLYIHTYIYKYEYI